MARYSIRGCLVWAGMAFALAAPAAWLALQGFFVGNWVLLLIGISGAVFFGLPALVLLFRCADRRVQLRVDDDHFWLRSHSNQPLPRRSIQKVGDRGSWIAIWLWKPENYPIATFH